MAIILSLEGFPYCTICGEGFDSIEPNVPSVVAQALMAIAADHGQCEFDGDDGSDDPGYIAPTWPDGTWRNKGDDDGFEYADPRDAMIDRFDGEY